MAAACPTPTTVPPNRALSRESAKPKVKKATGTCRIKRTGKGKRAKRTYACTIRLSKGTWTVTTQARSRSTVIAQSVRRAVVRR